MMELCAGENSLRAAEFVDHPRRLSRTTPLLEEAAGQLNGYFRDQRHGFDLPLYFDGTAFQVAVWQELQKIPYGCAVSYQDIARRVGRPNAVRAVGAANARNPLAIIVPCHRVIGANGHLTGYASGLWRKAWLLRHEGCQQVQSEPAKTRWVRPQ
ncbi:MAG TPA: methylated-DNA--[protein]-cysteine S-methyltransferase [Desulfobacteraceae bacterium]|nr:methylated-DNA--[protein]-cysteine S-methyltransferase [Deltaproteobacteria bacterium]MBW2356187.1 methylated-DNA--[protein]-cysteine S-methyltransferase [Deltaproteobacteria bacterium]RLB97891.1 MAG: cysteine methyltransferase [Deltaproteobacteria bacterium]HDI58993.1 methylated-DNA--[protein]-cysteine S-methyltransferase [Desulfobacteraceae bacterium]